MFHAAHMSWAMSPSYHNVRTNIVDMAANLVWLSFLWPCLLWTVYPSPLSSKYLVENSILITLCMFVLWLAAVLSNVSSVVEIMHDSEWNLAASHAACVADVAAKLVLACTFLHRWSLQMFLHIYKHVAASSEYQMLDRRRYLEVGALPTVAYLCCHAFLENVRLFSFCISMCL